MTIDYDQNFLIKVAPNLDLKDENGYLKVTNIKTKEWFIFKDKSVIDLLEYLKVPRTYQELTYNENIEIKNRNKEALDNLIDWRLVNIELELTVRDCPLCGTKENEVVVNKFNESFNLYFSYCKCKKCQTIFLNPCPSERAIHSLYSKIGYYSRTALETDGFLQRKIIKKSNKIRNSIIQKHMVLDKKKNILDIGCSTGEFIDHLYKEYNCRVAGLDVDLEGLGILNLKNPNVTTFHERIEDFNNDEIKYDIITAWGVIEHLSNPLVLFAKIESILKNDGIIVFDFPNISSKIAKWNLKNWPYLNPPFHITHFSEESFTKRIEEMGYALINKSYERTGSFLLKYSETLLYLLNRFEMNYQSKYVDNILLILSQPILEIERILNYKTRVNYVMRKK